MTTWNHFVGGSYKNKTRFLQEAKKVGISRRVPANIARGFHFGDRVILLRYHSRKGVEAFGEMVINEIIFPKEITEKIGAELIKSGAIEYRPGPLGGANVHRECGSYVIMGSYVITSPDYDIPQLVKMAQELDKENTVFCMIGGKLMKEYANPVWLDPAPKFTRGFIKSDDADTFEYEGENKIIEIANYRRK